MSLRLYLDDCADSNLLLSVLTGPPYHHTVVRPRDAALTGHSDSEHFTYARVQGLILVTKNPADFLALHQQHPGHPGIFAIYQDNRPRDISAGDTAQAIENLVKASVLIAGAFHVLNQWRY